MSGLLATTKVHGWREMKIERFEDIEAWQLARELTQKVYRLTQRLGKIAVLGQAPIRIPPRRDCSWIHHLS